jgi:hypothetical protein
MFAVTLDCAFAAGYSQDIVDAVAKAQKLFGEGTANGETRANTAREFWEALKAPFADVNSLEDHIRLFRRPAAAKPTG